MCLGFVSNFASFVTVRALLGCAEGGLLPGMVSYFILKAFEFQADLMPGSLPIPVLPT
jgi:hypothetical protein